LCVHNNHVFTALVQYMRTSGVPYKSRVISLVTRLLQTPEKFGGSDPPALSLLGGIRHMVSDRLGNALGTSTTTFTLSPRLQALVELVVTANIAQRCVGVSMKLHVGDSPLLVQNN
jgi:hypothetical protein